MLVQRKSGLEIFTCICCDQIYTIVQIKSHITKAKTNCYDEYKRSKHWDLLDQKVNDFQKKQRANLAALATFTIRFFTNFFY